MKSFPLAYENISFSSLFAAWDVSRETKSEEKRMFSQASFSLALQSSFKKKSQIQTIKKKNALSKSRFIKTQHYLFYMQVGS